jgi:hypothetical protein
MPNYFGSRKSKRRALVGCVVVVDIVYQSHTIRIMPREPTTQVAFRLADRLLARVDRHARRLGREHPGVAYTRADAVRDLLTFALEKLEATDSKRGAS